MRYFRTNVSKLPLGVATRRGSWGTLFNLAILKMFSSEHLTDDILVSPTLIPLEPERCPPDLLERVGQGMAWFQTHRFELEGFYAPNTWGKARGLAVHLLSEDLRTVGQVMYSETPEEQTLHHVCLSRTPEERFLATSNQKPMLPIPPFVKASRVRQVGPLPVIRRHLGLLEHQEVETLNLDRVRAMVEDLEARTTEYHLSTGLYVEVTREEALSLQPQGKPNVGAESAGEPSPLRLDDDAPFASVADDLVEDASPRIES